MSQAELPNRPNVVFVITDDQGYGDLSCHGNPVLRTPNLDRLHDESIRLTNFHVGPTCAPTRAGLMTGRYCNCTGVWHTIAGRSLLRQGEVTMADVFRASGYRTGMFGKWHLGDNYPFRPHDRGFDVALYHGGGGVSQTPDYWGNDYFDDTYFDRGEPRSFDGYCTDVWFSQAMEFIQQNASSESPFLCYLATNAPHAPYRVPERYAEPYVGRVPDDRARFYGMIANIDENVGRLRAHLSELDIERETVLIFMTDNGTSAGCRLDRESFVTEGFNAGMRGVKGSEYDGGHRTPFFLRLPGGTGRDVTQLTANIDILPTLAELCGMSHESLSSVHGTSLVPLIRGDGHGWRDRVVVTDSQRVERPIKWRKSATMTARWRLVNGTDLYDILADPEQRTDLAVAHPDVVEGLRESYERWWELVSERFDDDPAIIVGTDAEPVTDLTSHDWHNEQSDCAWNQGMVRQGHRCNGDWAIEVASGGVYRVELRRWPIEEGRAMSEGIPGETIDWYTGGRAIPFVVARLRVGEREWSQEVDPASPGVAFSVDLPEGRMRLQTWLTEATGEQLGAYYVYISRQA
ncbi:arylsulfatase [Candidatus Poribacteria bacterium]|nr:arylsulfatase [Candidatus Poribacteria bacterium]